MKLYNLIILVLQQIFFAKWKLQKSNQTFATTLPQVATGTKLRELKQNNYSMEKTFKIFTKGIPVLINQISTSFQLS